MLLGVRIDSISIVCVDEMGGSVGVDWMTRQ